jgi:diketogulonate reductase-like aldo/keto reductase
MPHTRRELLRKLVALGAAAMTPGAAWANTELLTRAIPVSGQQLPVIGLGSWLTFAVGDDPTERANCREIMQAFFDAGGELIDSSPMYMSAEEVIGAVLPEVKGRDALFAATKVWILGRELGIRQMERSRELWGIKRFDLMQVHNLLNWETHLETLKAWKAEGRIRYLGITTSHGRRHDEMEAIMRREPLDFVQFTYNLADREAETRLLPLAQERGIAVIANRPFQRGGLFERVGATPLPAWAAEFGATNWAQYFLKFIVSHPAVTCAIPATSQVGHLRENMAVLRGPVPDAPMRKRMLDHFLSL